MARGSISDEIIELKRELNDLNLILNKLVTTNITAQSKITDSMIKMDSLISEVKEMVELLQVATEIESAPAEIKGLSDLTENMSSLNKSLASIEVYVKKLYRRVFILTALKRDVKIPQTTHLRLRR